MNRHKLMARARTAMAGAWVAAAFVFLFAPLVVVVGASLDGGNRTFLNFPPAEISLRWYGNISADLFEALALSVALGLTTAFLACVIGVPAALGLVRAEFRGKAAVAALFRAPLQIPAVVIGVSFLKLYYLIGDVAGIHLVGSLPGLLIAHLFLATPYVIGSVAAVLQRFNPRLEEAALSLGASRLRALRRVTLPVIMPGVYAGAMYAFLVSFGDVPISLFLGAPGMQPFAAKIFNLMEFDFDPSLLAISTYIIIGSFAAIYLLQRAIGLDQFTRTGGG
jgi:putative spermidine/putrescine transport system permease protein